ncbi:PIR Superfamily Protein [Plasmodium ovale wallikeri]|uniref:PIR Superfamily Protein n=1 Tax=Plasmodium ovale wallikeri TaxID=864142 RepID=A0A1A9A5N0_PLAOA|nr:PIR Superfamily Protein [Plasmodium ovale wallikeri]
MFRRQGHRLHHRAPGLPARPLPEWQVPVLRRLALQGVAQRRHRARLQAQAVRRLGRAHGPQDPHAPVRGRPPSRAVQGQDQRHAAPQPDPHAAQHHRPGQREPEPLPGRLRRARKRAAGDRTPGRAGQRRQERQRDVEQREPGDQPSAEVRRPRRPKGCYNKNYIDMLKMKASSIQRINNILSSGIAILGFSLILVFLYRFSPLGSFLRGCTKKKAEVNENIDEEVISELYDDSENERSYISYHTVSH